MALEPDAQRLRALQMDSRPLGELGMLHRTESLGEMQKDNRAVGSLSLTLREYFQANQGHSRD